MTLDELKKIITENIQIRINDYARLDRYFEKYKESQEKKDDKKDDLGFLKAEILKLHEFNKVRSDETKELNKRLIDCESHLKFNQEKIKSGDRFYYREFEFANPTQELKYEIIDIKGIFKHKGLGDIRFVQNVCEMLNQLEGEKAVNKNEQ